MKKLFLLVVLWSIMGCLKEVELQYDGDEQAKIVLHGTISPQKGVLLNISKSIPPQEKLDFDQVFLNNALAVLFQDGIPVDTLVNVNNSGDFELSQNISIVEGKEYRLVVSAFGFDAASVQLRIPDSLDGLSMSYQPDGSDKGIIQVSFEPTQNELFYAEVIGYDSLNLVRPIFLQESSNTIDCPASWFAHKYFFHEDCLHKNNPKIVALFNKETIQWEPRAIVLLHKIKLLISKIDPEYETIIDFSDNEEVGFSEPVVIESNVEGGYGYVLPINPSEAIVTF